MGDKATQDGDAPGSAIERGLAEIFRRHRHTLLEEVRALEDAVAAAMADQLEPEVAEHARRQAHKLAGTGGMFGLHRTSQLALELESAFGSPRPGSAEWVTRTARLVVDLADTVQQEAAQGIDEGERPVAAVDALPSMLVCLDDRQQVAEIRREARRRGLRVELPDGGRGVTPGISDEQVARVDVVVVSAAAARPSLTGVLAAVAARGDGVPVLALTDPDEPVDRVEVLRRGGRAFLTEPVGAGSVLDAVEELLGTRRLEGVSIVAVDDDPAVLEVVDSVVAGHGVTVETVNDPRAALGVVERLDPDLVILDVDMPGVSGIELCRVIRADVRWSGLSILFLTTHTDAETITTVFGAGADDYVAKPINREELLVRIRNRIERIRLTRRLAETDPLTGAASRRQARAVMSRLVRWADRHHEPLSVAVLDPDDFRRVNAEHGHELGDDVLRSIGARLLETFHGQDLVARWAGQEFLVALHGLARRDAVERLASVLEGQRSQRYRTGSGPDLVVTLAGGVAQYPDDGRDLHGLYLAADGARRRAKASGGDRLVAVGDDPGDANGSDIVLVEDDAALAAVIVGALETRGWSVRWLDRGDDAGRELLDKAGKALPRLVLLDWDLPGEDGPTVLRRLAASGRLERTRVIMLTVHASEDAVVRTLELGAVDHVAKPVSIPVLLQRVRRALDRPTTSP